VIGELITIENIAILLAWASIALPNSVRRMNGAPWWLARIAVLAKLTAWCVGVFAVLSPFIHDYIAAVIATFVVSAIYSNLSSDEKSAASAERITVIIPGDTLASMDQWRGQSAPPHPATADRRED